MGNVAAENFCTFLGLEPVARRIMRQRWLEIIVQGKLSNDNAGKLAVAKQACPTHHFSGCSSFLHRVRTLARINILFAGPLRKRLVVLDIKHLVDLNNVAQNSGPDRSKFM